MYQIQMANTYTQLYIHAIFAVRNREGIISETWAERLQQYITTILQNNGHKMIAIGGMSDHLHLFFGYNPTESLSHLIQEIKRDSSLWINQEKLVNGKFYWQEGYGAFSYSHSQINAVANYVNNQKQHHTKQSFQDEYLKILKDFKVEFDEKYIFKSLL
jgi:putative transposase